MGESGKPTVLVIDDKRANQLALDALLSADYNLVFANSGPQGIALVQKVPAIDVILMDVQMPEMDGFEAAREIKNLPAGKDIPIIFVTAVFNEDPFIRKGYEAGGLDYFSKPFDPAILKMKVGIYASFRTREKLLRARERHIRESEELLRVGRKLSSMLESLRVGVMIADVLAVGAGILAAAREVLVAEHRTEASQAQLAARMKAEIERWAETVKKANIPLQD